MSYLSIILLIITAACVTADESTSSKNSQNAKTEIAKSRIPNVDGNVFKGQFVDLRTKTKERIYIRFNGHADSGVEMDRVSEDRKVIWRTYIGRLGTSGFKFIHNVSVRIITDDTGRSEGQLEVTSTINRKTAIVKIDLSTGKQLSRRELAKDR